MSFNDNVGALINSNNHLKNILLPFKSEFKIAHLNCQSIRPSASSSKFDELKMLLDNSFFDVFAISETWLKPYVSTRSLAIPGYSFCRNDRLGARGGGVGVFVSNVLKFKVVFKSSLYGICESLFMEIYLDNIRLLFGVVYLPHGDIVTFETEHFHLFSSYPYVVIAGDFNYNLFDVSKSATFRSLCTRCNLKIIHNNRPTHIDVVHGSTSLIDLMLTSDLSTMSFSEQFQYPGVSRHAIICACFKFRKQLLPEYFEYRDYNNIDYEGISRYFFNYDESYFFDTSDVDLLCSYTCTLFHNLLLYVPIVRRKAKVSDNAWMMSRDVTLARSLRDLAFLSYRANKTVENWIVFKKYRNRAKKTMRYRKRQHDSKLFDNLDCVGIWKVLKNSGCLGDEDQSFGIDVDMINDYFVNVGSSNVTGSFNVDNLDFSNSSASFQCISESDVLIALNRVKSNSIGTDGIPIQFIRKVFPYVSKYLIHLFNSILMTSKFPSGWKTARVVPIPKSKVVNGPEDLRPISILPALSKVMEHILKEQILTVSASRVYHSQYAFRKGHNTTGLLLNLTDSIRQNVNDDKFSVLISLDLSKAFNCINFARMIDKLRIDFGFSLSACRLILSYLNERFQYICANGTNSRLLPLYSGVPQGSVLGPILFIMYMNDLPCLVNSSICQSFLYADDVALLFSCSRDFPDVLENNINYCLQTVSDWAHSNSMSINGLKTKAMVFNPFDRFNVALNVNINNTRVEFLNQIKCLGVILDSKLNFELHIDLIISRVVQSLRKIYSTNLFYPLNVRYKLAYALLMSQVLYGIEIFTSTVASNISKINRIVNSIVRFVYRVNHSEHISQYVKTFLGCSFFNFINLRCLVYFYKAMKRGFRIPLLTAFIFSRSTRNPQIFIPRITNSFYERSFLIRVARCWNHLPIELRVFSHSNNVFRLKLLNFLFDLDTI